MRWSISRGFDQGPGMIWLTGLYSYFIEIEGGRARVTNNFKWMNEWTNVNNNEYHSTEYLRLEISTSEVSRGDHGN